jgi:hypothetical protein
MVHLSFLITSHEWSAAKVGMLAPKNDARTAKGECHQGIKGRGEEANGGGQEEEEEKAAICAKYVRTASQTSLNQPNRWFRSVVFCRL